MARKPNMEPSDKLRRFVEEPRTLEGTSDATMSYNDHVQKLLELEETRAPLGARLKARDDLWVYAGRALYEGMDPKEVPLNDLLFLQRRINHERLMSEDVHRKVKDRIKGPLTAIRAFCVECQNGQLNLVRECESFTCVLWPFRMATNPLYGKIPDADAVSVEAPEDQDIHTTALVSREEIQEVPDVTP